MPEHIEKIIAKLKRRAATRSALAIVGVIAGTPLCFVAALILGTIFWFSIGRMLKFAYPWSYFFWGTALITIPLLFRTEIQTRGDFLGGVARDIDSDARTSNHSLQAPAAIPAPFLSLVAYHAAINPRAATAGFVELFITGPRWVLAGVRHLRLVGKIPKVDLEQTASVINKLLEKESGMESRELISAFDSRDQLQESLIWLAFYGWVGVSTKHDRVYIYSESRRFLAN
ncbi:MAG: hypothetical protein H6818_05455 [Phycisphaerales bacterium]|nr:hypothetical protein [Phycisphaerales bacterium]